MPLPTTPGGWPCILADPPWSFRDKGSRIAPDWSAARGGYSTMTSREIAALPVRDIAADDALLFLWTTSAHLLDGSAITVARSWGFEPKTTVVWVKARWRTATRAEDIRAWNQGDRSLALHVGMGHYVRAAHELVVLARRGRARVLRHDVPSVFFAPRSRHSEKPVVLHEIAEKLTSGPRLELFARRRRLGWRCWGSQLSSEMPQPASGSLDAVVHTAIRDAVARVSGPIAAAIANLAAAALERQLSGRDNRASKIGARTPKGAPNEDAL